MHYRDSESAARDIVDDIKQQTPGDARLVQADVSVEAELAGFVESCWNALGEVDIWVNNAGADLLTGEGKNLPPGQKLTALWDTDVRSTVLLSRDIGGRMKERGRGTILNIGWDQADRGMEGDSGELFAATKNAIMGFTRSLAVSLAPEVRVNCIAPGWIKTAWGRIGPGNSGNNASCGKRRWGGGDCRKTLLRWRGFWPRMPPALSPDR